MEPRQLLDRFLANLRQVEKGPPPDLVGFLGSLPQPGEVLSAWDAWCLIGLVRYRQKKIWGEEIIRTRLLRDCKTTQEWDRFLPRTGLRDFGDLPGLPQWRYDLGHRPDCRLVHKIHPEFIEVNLRSRSVGDLEPDDFPLHLHLLGVPDPVERRLKDLFWRLPIVEIAMGDLHSVGAMKRGQISNQVLAYEVDFDSFRLGWSQPEKRIWLAALIGDWDLANRLAVDHSAIREITRPRQAQSLQSRRERILKLKGRNANTRLYGLADLGGAEDELSQALENQSLPMVNAALEVVKRRNDKRWCPQVHALMSRTKREGHDEKIDIWNRCLRFLLEHGYEKAEMVKALSEIVAPPFYEAALLALKHAPELALNLIRRSLRSPHFLDRFYATIALTQIGKPWCKRELRRALEASHDLEQTREFRTAVRELGDAEFLAIVNEWGICHPKTPLSDHAEVSASVNGSGRSDNNEEDRLNSWSTLVPELWFEIRDLVLQVREVELADSEGVPALEDLAESRYEPTRAIRPWWKFWGR